MGTWSYICKGGCGKPISEGEDVVGISAATYDGYGKAGEGEDQAMYHRACYRDLVVQASPSLLNFEPGDHDPDQGCSYPDPRFVPEGTVLYDPAFDALKGATKVGVLMDVSGSSPLIHAEVEYGTKAVVDMLAPALHYIGPKEIELILFSDKVTKQETLPDGNQLYARVVYDVAREGWPLDVVGGGDRVDKAFYSARMAGCDAVIIVSDGAHSSWPEACDLPTVHVLLVNDEERAIEMPVPAWVAAQTRSAYFLPLTDQPGPAQI